MADEKKRVTEGVSAFFTYARSQAESMAESVKRSAESQRTRLDGEGEDRDGSRWLRAAGEQVYQIYAEGRRVLPSVVQDAVVSLDRVVGRVVSDERVTRVGEVAETIARDITGGIGDFLENVVRQNDSAPHSSTGASKQHQSEMPTQASDSTPSVPKPVIAHESEKTKSAVLRNDGKAKKPAKTKKTQPKAPRKSVLAKDPLADLKKTEKKY